MNRREHAVVTIRFLVYFPGRAWLYSALNDQILESYLKCFVTNQPRVAKFYASDSLVADTDLLEIIISLCMGLEHFKFDLNMVKSTLFNFSVVYASMVQMIFRMFHTWTWEVSTVCVRVVHNLKEVRTGQTDLLRL